MSISNTFSSAAFLPSHTCGESEARGAQQVGGEGAFELPGVARRLVTFFCFAKKKVTQEKATPIRHLFEVPCVARLVRRLRNSHCVLRQSSPKPPLVCELSRRRSGDKIQKWSCVGMNAHAVFFKVGGGALRPPTGSRLALPLTVFALRSPVPQPSSGGGSGNSDEYVRARGRAADRASSAAA